MLAQCWKSGRECVWVTGELPGHNIKVVAPVYNHRTPSEIEVVHVRDLLVTQANSRSNGAHWPWVSLVIIGETGARVGSVEKLRVRDFDAESARLTLQGKVTE